MGSLRLFSRVFVLPACLILGAAAAHAQTALDAIGAPIYGAAHAISGSLAAVGTDGKSIVLRGPFNATVNTAGIASDAFASVAVDRSFDKGASWTQAHCINCFGTRCSEILSADGGPTAANGISLTWSEPESGVLYRVRTTELPVGASITYRLSQ